MPLQPITFGSYGTGAKPIISGADLLNGFTLHSGPVWKKTVDIALTQQLFFDGIRGVRKTSISALTADKDWFYDNALKILYIYSSSNPSVYTSPGIEASARSYAVFINSNYVVVSNLQIEKTSSTALPVSTNSEGAVVDNLTFLQWTNEENSGKAGIVIAGNNFTVKNSVFGRQTGNDLADQGWAGFVSILVKGMNAEITNNKFYHSSTENENGNGFFAYGINVVLTPGTLKIHDNYIYHVGSSGITMSGYSKAGDVIEIYNNTMEYPGQAGIAAYKTRIGDGIGGKGYVYKNLVSYANRLGGDVGGKGNQSSGIHFNDGVKAGTEAGKPYMKWYCYENIVHNTQALKMPNGYDSDGIALDYNASNTEVFKNLLYNNYGRGIYIWSANNCKVSYNIIYGNDAGISVSARSDGTETADSNIVFNNVFYKNYNGDGKGQNLDAEIYFGWYGKNNVFKNNILYASENGYTYSYNSTESSGHITDYNLLYNDLAGVNLAYDQIKGRQNFTQWQTNHPQWDRNSVNADPLFRNPAEGDFSLKENSPAMDKGVNLGQASDFNNIQILGLPDLGVLEYIDIVPPTLQTVQIINDVCIKVNFSEKVNSADIQNPMNYSVSDNISVISAVADTGGTIAILTTSIHNSGNFTIHAANISDLAGNLISSSGCGGNYNFTACPADTVIRISADQGILSGSAALKTQPGTLSAKAACFSSTNGEITYTVKLPKSAYWYGWARLYYGNSSVNNSFIIRANNRGHILGDDSTITNRWHYDGYQHADIHLGSFQTGEDLVITIRPREPGETVLLDQILITPNPDFVPQDEPSIMPVSLLSPLNDVSAQPVPLTLKWSKDPLAVNYGVQVASDSFFSTIIFSSDAIADTFVSVNGFQYSTKYFWRVKSQANGMESNWSVVWNFKSETGKVILINANEGIRTGDARLGTKAGMKNTNAIYFRGPNGGVSYNVNIPETGQWYVWARMFYMSSGGKNSFNFTVKGVTYVLGDDDTKYDQWHWDGYHGEKISVGILNSGANTIMISGREPGLTLWVDQIVLTNDPNYNPTVLGKEVAEENSQETESLSVPAAYDVSQNFPNPFNPTTSIRFSLPENGFVSLKVYDILGNEVADVVNSAFPAGYHEVKFNAANLASGIYIYQLRAGSFNKTLKMQLLK